MKLDGMKLDGESVMTMPCPPAAVPAIGPPVRLARRLRKIFARPAVRG